MAAFAREGAGSHGSLVQPVTVAPARMLGLGDRIGSLDVGKDADLIVLSGDPLSVKTRVLQTFVEGRQVFDRDDPEDRLFAVGGFGASRDQKAEPCCIGPALGGLK